MKILMLSRDKKYGIGSHIRGLTKYLRKNGIKVDEVYGGGNIRTNIRLLIEDIDSYDLVHVQGSPFCVLKTSIPKITTVHSFVKKEREYDNSFAFRLGEYFEKKTLETSQALIFVNKSLVYEYCNYYPDMARFDCMTWTIPNGLDLEEFDGKIRKRGDFVISGGRNTKRKNFQEVRDVCKSLDISLIEFGVESYIPRSGVLDLFKYAKCFISSSLYETGSIVMLEAMVSKCPIIYRECEFSTNLLGSDGIPYSTLEDLKRLLRVKAFSTNCMVESAYKKVKENYDWNVLAKKTIDVYKSVINE